MTQALIKNQKKFHSFQIEKASGLREVINKKVFKKMLFTISDQKSLVPIVTILYKNLSI